MSLRLLMHTTFFFFNDTATTEIYTLSLHDALPILQRGVNDHTVLELVEHFRGSGVIVRFIEYMDVGNRDRKSTRLNSSHGYISYAVFCLKKKKIKTYYSRGWKYTVVRSLDC